MATLSLEDAMALYDYVVEVRPKLVANVYISRMLRARKQPEELRPEVPIDRSVDRAPEGTPGRNADGKGCTPPQVVEAITFTLLPTPPSAAFYREQWCSAATDR